MEYNNPLGYTLVSYSAMVVKLSYTTVVTRSLQGDVRYIVSNGCTLSQMCHLGIQTYVYNDNKYYCCLKDVMIGFTLDHDYCFFET